MIINKAHTLVSFIFMNLTSLFESSSADSIKLRISALKDQRKQLIQRHAGSGFQSGINPIYANRVNQIDAQLKVLYAELEHALKAPEIEKQILTQRQQAASNVPQQTHGDRVKQGMQRWLELAQQYGGEHGLNKAIRDAAIKQTDNGRYFLDVKQLATDFDVAEKTMRKRLEFPQLVDLLNWLPRSAAGVSAAAIIRARNKAKDES